MTEVAKKLTSYNNMRSALQKALIPESSKWTSFPKPKESEDSKKPVVSGDLPIVAKEEGEKRGDIPPPRSSVTCACSFKLGVIVGLETGFVIHVVGPKTEVELGKHNEAVRALSASEDIAVSGSEDGIVMVWDFKNRQYATLGKHDKPVTCIVVLPGEKYVISGSEDCTVNIWNVRNVTKVTILEGHERAVTCVSFMHGGNLIVSGSSDKKMIIWNSYSVQYVRIADTIDNKSPVTCLAVMPGSDRIVSGALDGVVRVWEWHDYGLGYGGRGELIHSILGHTASVTCILTTETSDSIYIFSGSEDHTVRHCESGYWDESQELVEGHTGKVTCLALLSDGKHVASGSDDKTLRIWSLEETKSVGNPFKQEEKVNCLAAMPDTDDIVLGLITGIQLITNVKSEVPTLRAAVSRCEDFTSVMNDLKPNDPVDPRLENGESIQPDNYNALHVCAYKQDLPNLEKRLKDLKVIRGAFGSPLTIALDKKFTKCVDAILKYLSNEDNKGKQFSDIQAIAEDFPELLKFKNLHYLVPFFQTLLYPSTQKVDKVFSPKHQLPCAVFRTCRTFHLSDFKNEKGRDSEEVEFLISLFRWSFARGSEKFLKLMRALEDSEDRKILTTPVVTHLVQSRWENLLVPARLHTAFYLSLLLCLVGITFSYWEIGTFVEVTFVSLNVLFLIINLVRSASKREEYWLDVWYYVRVFGCIASLACLAAQYEVDQDFLYLISGACFFRGIVSHKSNGVYHSNNIPEWIQYIDNWLYVCSLLYLLGMAFNYWSLGVPGIILICVNNLVLLLTSIILFARGRVWNHGKVFVCLASIVWGGLWLYGADNLQYLHFVMVCMYSLCCAALLRRDSRNVSVIYICLILCLTEITFNYWGFGFLGIVFICLNALFLLYNLVLLSQRESSYLSDVWNYVDGIEGLVGTTWVCLMYFEAEQPLVSQFGVIFLCSLYVYSLLRNNKSTSHLLLYLCSLPCLIGIVFNYWSLGVLEIVYIGMNVSFLLFEISWMVQGGDYWKDGWSYVQLIQCFASITWGWLVFFEVENLQYLQVAVMSISLIRGLAVFSKSDLSTVSYIRMALYTCLLLCLVGMTLNWNLGTLNIIFLCLNALLLSYEIVEVWKKGSDYWTDVWNYVTLLQCITSSVWGCLLYYEVEHLQYLHILVLSLCFLRSFTFFHCLYQDVHTLFYLFYLFSLLYLVEITFHSWSLVIIFICMNALFLLYEVAKSLQDLKAHWTAEWNYVHVIICLTGVAWGLSMYFEVDQLQNLYILMVSMIFLRILSFFPDFKMTGYNLLYLGSLLCLSGITINYWSLNLLEIIFISLNVLFLLYEIIQCVANGTDYLLDIWNYVDLTRCITSIVWGCLIYNDVEEFLYLHFAVVCLSFFRGFTFFRTFKMTRMFVRMVLEVVKDMYSFLVILAFSTCAFGMMYAVLDKEITNVPDAWAYVYNLLVGNSETDKFGYIEWFWFTAATLVNVIIMLNLLISILSKAYEKAQESVIENDTLEMLRLVIEYESMLFWKPKDSESTVMIVCKAAESDVEEDELTKKITEIKRLIEEKLGPSDPDSKQKPERPIIETKMESMEEKIEAVENSQLVMRTKMETLEKKIDQILAVLQPQH